MLEPFRTKRKILYQHPPDQEILKPPDHDLTQNSPDNYVVTPHRKRRPGFHNSPSQNPPFVPYSPSYIEDLRSRKGPPSSSAPPSYFPGKFHLLNHHNAIIFYYIFPIQCKMQRNCCQKNKKKYK